MSRRDLKLVSVVGVGVGLLIQPILANFMDAIQKVAPLSAGSVRLGTFLFFTLLAPFALFVASIIAKKIAVVYQFAKFAAVGTLNSFVDLGIFNLSTFLFGAVPSGIVFAIFKAISFLAGTTNSFIWNKYWTFDTKGKPEASETIKFYAIAIAGGFLNVGIATYVFRGLTRPEFITADAWLNLVAPLTGILVVFMWNFLGYKFFVFNKREKKEVDN